MRGWVAVALAGGALACQAPVPSDPPPEAPAAPAADDGWIILEAPRGDGLLRAPPRVVVAVDEATGEALPGFHLESRAEGTVAITADGYLPAVVVERWPGPVRLRRGTWVDFEVRDAADVLLDRRRDLVDPTAHLWTVAREGYEPAVFGVGDLRLGNAGAMRRSTGWSRGAPCRSPPACPSRCGCATPWPIAPIPSARSSRTAPSRSRGPRRPTRRPPSRRRPPPRTRRRAAPGAWP
jgi:hypothetical protein